MKKITIYIVLAVLCLNFKIKAQDNKAVDVTAKGIQIGQPVPDITINNIHNYKTTTTKISDFKGKLLILDFWATWCSPCVAMIPKMDSLQKQFGDRIQFLSVTYQSEKEVMPFLGKFEEQQQKHYSLPIVTDSKELHKLFPHISLPHYVWIGPDGKVKAITESKEVSKENISKMLSGNSEMDKKSDFKIAYDNTKPFLINGNGGDGSNLIYYSVLTKFTEGITPGYSRTPLVHNDNGKISSYNTTLEQLYRIAFGGYDKYFGPSRIILNVKDASSLTAKKKGGDYLNWLRNGNGFCYQLIVPPNQSAQMFEIMKSDLNNFFTNYVVNTEKRKVKCLVLKRTSKAEKFKTNGEKPKADFSPSGFEMRNSLFSVLTMRMEFLFMQNSPYPIVDGTNYKLPIDLTIEGKLSDLSNLNTQLAKYDLKFEVDDFITDVLIIADRSKVNTN